MRSRGFNSNLFRGIFYDIPQGCMSTHAEVSDESPGHPGPSLQVLTL